ncbi:MAG: carbohydrate kinase [Geminicoccaceae bacterium]|nr:carbohydrate kinase [Geminicoccaceae bacterium]
MTKDVLVGIDAGTSMMKAVAFDLEGRQVAVASLPNRYVELGDGGVEQDMAATWEDAAGVLRRLGEAVPDLKGRVAALAVTGQGDGTWLVGEAGGPAAPAWLWLDSRASGIVADLRKGEAGRRFHELTGAGLNACMQGAHLAWMARHRPDVLDRAACAMHCKDWLYVNLTGVRATDPSEGSFTFGDFRKGSYAPEILDILGIASCRRLLPPIVDGVRTHHKLTEDAARAVGLLPGTPVVLAYVDVICTGLGGGLYDPVRTVGCTVLGTTGMHMRVAHGLDQIALNPAHTGYTMFLPAPDTWAQMQSNMAATLNIDWLVRRAEEVLTLFGDAPDRREILQRLDGMVADAEPGKVLYHPFIHEAGERGPFVDPFARAQFLGLTMNAGFVDLMRGVYEGLGFAARDCYAAMGDLPEEVRLAGGAARSRALRRILAACLNRPVRTSHREEAGAAGAAMTAAMALGHYDDLAACCAEWVEPTLGEPEAPDPALAARYDALFPVYREGYRRMVPVWPDLHAARRPKAVKETPP